MRVQVLKEMLDLWLSKNGQVTTEQLSQHVHDLVDEKAKDLAPQLEEAFGNLSQRVHDLVDAKAAELETRLLAKIEEKLGKPPAAQ